MAAILVGALLAVGASAGGSPAHADFGSGMEAYRAKDYATARAIFLDLAEIGDGPSQYNLGAMALRGEAAPADRGAALGWMRAASENGYQVDAAVLHRLAAQASPAELATADAVVGRYGAAALEATVLPRRPSEGRATGRLEPPRILSTGEVRYPPRALQRRQPGFVVVRFVIGSDGVPRDERTLLSVPALDDGGEAFAQEVLRVVAERRYRPALCNGRPVDSDMCLRVNFSMPGDVLELKPWLVAWVRERAQAGHPYYQYVLGVLAQASPPIDVSPADGLKMIVAAAQAGVPEAQYYVGSMLLAPAEAAKAAPWLRRAAAAGRPDAQAAYALDLLQRPDPPLHEIRALLPGAAKTRTRG